MAPQILTDSTSDLSQELVDRFSIKVIPLPVIIHNQVYQDGININIHQLYKLVDEYGELPKTSAPSVAAFTEFFSQSNDAIHLSISSKLSSSYQNAIIASQGVEPCKIAVIDSLNLSTGIGLLVLRAAEMAQTGCSTPEIINQINANIPRVRTSFVIDKLDYLYMGGRCTAMQSIVSSILKIRPVIEVKNDGTLGIKDKCRGTRTRALGILLEDFRKKLDQIDLHRVFITHSGCPDDAEYLRNGLLSFCQPDELLTTVAGSVIASHCGPNTIGILYLLKAG